MDKKKLILLVGALIIAVGTAFAARTMFAGAAAPQAEAAAEVEPTGPKVLVAKRGLPVGTIITADAVSYQLWPQELVQDAYFIDGEADMEQLLGTVVRHPITAGEPVTQGSLVSPGDRGFLAAALGPGMRAVTVPVSARTGVAGFVFPGDRVDMVLTQTVQGDEGLSMQTSETILTNLRVLATDQSTETTTDENGRTVVRAFRTVTMEVTPRIAERITVAQTIGTISLTLRSIADNQAELDRAIAAGEIDLPDDASPEEEEELLRTAMSRPGVGSPSFQTGGDVSRFQPRSIPMRGSNKDDEGPRRDATPQMTPGVAANAAPSGPTVRVTRGQTTVVTPVGQGAGRLLDRQSSATGEGGRVGNLGMGTIR
ncbi:Flp pilus assembly protein CpaB [Aurantiacibacter gangjinensis]|uniref:Pilus assembly protein CpaB n=1 Tax=Aurantiacibacter gangjinensis TaxID=502682 RepID=A0A0G9MW39_9SPHN|nr:Flp pilus assembly protein CpaB [Aurantiacibacter gangjinensis]APE27068.1 Flp pilus assembly protein RcpC/CpaB [Aurantiacibacter gangjinensis]KLE33493.1 pilus assembly protein CpaB [Aurantiacibacter gangjinensis]